MDGEMIASGDKFGAVHIYRIDGDDSNMSIYLLRPITSLALSSDGL